MKTLLIIQIFVVALIGTGWVKDIIKLSHCDFEAPYNAEIIYGVGLVPLVGMVTGWLDIEDGKQQTNK